MQVFWPFWCGVVLYGVRGDGCYYVHLCMGDREGDLLMVDYDDGCGNMVCLGYQKAHWIDVIATLKSGG